VNDPTVIGRHCSKTTCTIRLSINVTVPLFLGVAFAAQLEAVRAGAPAPASADPLMTAARSNTATAPGALSPNLESSHQSTLHAPQAPAGSAASAR